MDDGAHADDAGSSPLESYSNYSKFPLKSAQKLLISKQFPYLLLSANMITQSGSLKCKLNFASKFS